MVIWQTNRYLLHEQFANDAHELLTDSPYTWYVISGYRSLAEQKILHEKYLKGEGGKAAPPGKSAHNFKLAIDVVLDGSEKPGLQMLWDTKHEGWLWLAWAIRKHPRLHSGMWFADWPHIERLNWQNFKGQSNGN